MADWGDFKPTSKAFSNDPRDIKRELEAGLTTPLVLPFNATTGTTLPNNDLVVDGKSWPLLTHGRCTDHHPALVMPGTDKVIYGGACSHPVQTDCDIYVGLDWGFVSSCPWDDPKPLRIAYKITDMHAPDDPKSFKLMISWLKAQLDDGKKVHVGCIGGHGRTGTVLAALVSLYGEPDAISYVRQHYCGKAVETSEQVLFLAKHFGVTPVDGAKEKRPSKMRDFRYDGYEPRRSTGILEGTTAPKLKSRKEKVDPMTECGCIFGKRLDR